MLDHVSHPWLNPHFGNCDYLLFIDPVYSDSDILVNAFIRRPAHCGPVHCKIHAGCVFNKVHGVRWAVRVLLPWLTSQCVYRPCLDNTSQTGFIFSIVIKLVFHLRVTITIKGETQMGSVSNKDSMGY